MRPFGPIVALNFQVKKEFYPSANFAMASLASNTVKVKYAPVSTKKVPAFRKKNIKLFFLPIFFPLSS